MGQNMRHSTVAIHSLEDSVMLAVTTFEYTEIQVGLYSERVVFTIPVVSS